MPLSHPDRGDCCLGIIMIIPLSYSTENTMQKLNVKMKGDLSDHLSGTEFVREC